jgi:hypothetical protein
MSIMDTAILRVLFFFYSGPGRALLLLLQVKGERWLQAQALSLLLLQG